MRPPMTATKNDGISPPNWKTVLVQQKEVLAENKKYQATTNTTPITTVAIPLQQSQSQQQQQQQQQQIQASSLLNDDCNDLTKLINNSCDFGQKLVNPSLSAAATAAAAAAVTTTTVAITTTTTTASQKSKSNPSENLLNDEDFIESSKSSSSDQKTAYSNNFSNYSQPINNNSNNSKLKRISSDVSDRRNQIKPQTVSRNSSSSSLISFRTNNCNNNSSSTNSSSSSGSSNHHKNNNHNKKNINNNNNNKTALATASNSSSNNSNLSEVPKNLFINTFEQLQNYEPKLLASSSSTTFVSLPLSETEPLLTNIDETTVIDSKRSICLNKNSASLIFTKKDLSNVVSCNNINNSINKNDKNLTNFKGNNFLNSSNSIVHLRTIKGANNNSHNISNNQNHHLIKHQNFGVQRSCDGGVETENLLQRRRSLQLNYSTICRETIGNIRQNSTTATATNRKQHAYSWYAPVYSALEEEIEQDSRDSSPIHNLASIKGNNDLNYEKVSLLDKNQINVQPQLHQPRIRRTGNCQNPPNTIGNGIVGGQIHSNQNETEGPQVSQSLGGPMPRRKRIENFFKSLVGRKPSKDPLTTTTITTPTTPTSANSTNNTNTNPNPPILQSPEITITRTPSEQNLQREIGAGSTTSLNAVQQKLWNVVPLLKREGQGSTTSLHQDKADSIVHYSGMRKCETVLALSRQSSTNGGVEQIRPLNRLRNSLSTSNATCSRCSSLLSLAASGSRYSLNVANSGFISVNNASSNSDSKTNLAATSSNIITAKDSGGGIGGGVSGCGIMTTVTAVSQQLASNFESITCKLCLTDVKMNSVTTIGQCGCSFCTDCMTAYIEFEISEGAYEISCPDAQCPSQGIITLTEIACLASSSLMKKHHRYRLNREIELDKNRTWCPRAGCETVCQVGEASSSSPTASSSNDDKVNSIIQVLCAVQCPTCREEFCSGCKKPWHPNVSCDENNRRLVAEGQENRVGIPFDNDLIKCCPMCAVPIEKDEGCAQMMCKRCKHVFCWYCLASLDDDFLLRHYDKGPCKNKLGHSRASVVWHRAQVIGIFAGFGILLLVASPLLLLAAPCIICCKCRICSGAAKLEDADTEFDEAVALQR